MAASATVALDAGSSHSPHPNEDSQHDADMDCRDADAHDLTPSRDPNTTDAGTPRQREVDGDWQTVLTLRQRKAQARERHAKTPDHDGVSHPQQSSNGQTQCPRRKPRYRRLPPLPRDDFKVIVRPHQGLPIKNFTSPTLADAVIAACGGLITGEQFLLRIKPGSNIFIVSTPHQEVAEKVRSIARLVVNGQPHSVNAYVATGDGATRGVIHGLPPRTPPDVIKANLKVRTQGVEILHARMLGDTKTAVITFYGTTVPRCVYYRGGELPCYPYKTPRKCAKSVTMSATDLTYAPNRTLRYVEPVACENPFPAMSASQNAQPVAKTISQETAIVRRGSNLCVALRTNLHVLTFRAHRKRTPW